MSTPIERDQRAAGSRRPQPVLTAAQASAAATWLTALLVGYLANRGVLVPDEVTGPIADLVAVGIVGAVGAIGSLIAGLVARAKVTPVADPRADNGTRLVPARTATPPATRPSPAQAPAAPPPPAPADLPTDQIPVVDVAALRKEYRLDT